MTPEEQAAASAAWLAANHPEWNQQNTAAQAAALNLQWRAVNAPSTITPSELQQANIYRQQFQQQQQAIYNQQIQAQIQRQQYGGFADQDAYREAQKHAVYFHPETVNPANLSPEMREKYYNELRQNEHEYYRQ